MHNKVEITLSFFMNKFKGDKMMNFNKPVSESMNEEINKSMSKEKHEKLFAEFKEEIRKILDKKLGG